MPPALGTHDFVLVRRKERVDFFLAHLFVGEHARFFQEMIHADARMTFLAFRQRVAEPADMSRRLPHLRMHENRAVETHDILVLAHHSLPPRLADITRKLNPVRSKIIHGGEPAIDLRTWKHEPAPLRKRNQLVHQVFDLRHKISTHNLQLTTDNEDR